jgi:hypothetical protein
VVERIEEILGPLVGALGARGAAGRLRGDVEWLAGQPRSRVWAPDGMRRAQEYAAAELTAAGWRVRRMPFETRWRLGATDRPGSRSAPFKLRLHRRLAGANLLAEPMRPGRGPTVLVAAHLDTVEGSPGADDNASGVAVVLEAARLLGALPEPPDVTFLLTDLEEAGLIGARIAARTLGRGRPIAAMICLESVGHYATEPGSQRLPRGAGTLFRDAVAAVRANGHRGDFVLVVHRRSSRSTAAIWQEAAALTGRLSCVPLRDPRPDGPLGSVLGLAVPPLGHLGRSDHAPFWNRGIPALMLTDTAEFRNPHYHRPTDTADTLDYRRLAAVAVATAATAATVARC